MAIAAYDRPLRWVCSDPWKTPENLNPNKSRGRIMYSPDGKHVLFAPPTGGLQVWDESVTQIVAQPVEAEAGSVLATGISQDSKALVACSADGTVRAFSLPAYEPSRTWRLSEQMESKTSGKLTAAMFSRDASLLAVGEQGGKVLLFESTGKFLRELSMGMSEVEALAWSPDTRVLAVASQDGNVRVLDTNSGTLLYQKPVSASGISCIRFDPSARWLLAGARGQDMKIWDVATGEQLLTAPTAPWSFARDGRRLAVGGTGSVGLCEMILPVSMRQLTGHPCEIVRLAWSRDNRHIASLDAGFEVRVWDAANADLVNSFRERPGRKFASNAAIALSEDSSLLAYANGGETLAHIRDVRTGNVLAEWNLPKGFERLAYTSQGRFLLVREEEAVEGTSSLRSVARELTVGGTAQIVRVLRAAEPDDRLFLTSSVTPDGRFFWWVGPRRPPQNRRMEVREVATGRLIKRVPVPTAGEHPEPGGLLSPDGRYLWVAATDKFLRYDLLHGRPPDELPANPTCVSPDLRWQVFFVSTIEKHHGTRIALRHGAEAQTWLEFVNNDLSCPADAAFSPNGRYLAWGSQNGTITVADLDTLRIQVREFEESSGLTK